MVVLVDTTYLIHISLEVAEVELVCARLGAKDEWYLTSVEPPWNDNTHTLFQCHETPISPFAF